MKYTPLSLALSAAMLSASAFAGTVTIESWRTDDATIWNETIIPAFKAKHPDIDVVFKATPPADYDAAMTKALGDGSAGDLITCRPFDASLNLFNSGYLADITNLDGLVNFPRFAKSAWQTDSGAQTFCLPMASVIHGFFYNKAIFTELGIEPPKTQADFTAILDKIKANGKYVPLVMGTADKWEAATMGFQNVGPNFWKGEDGREALLAGKGKFTDAPYVATLEQLATWGPYLGDGYQSRGYGQAQELFAAGQGAIYPAGSWDITAFRSRIDLGVFRPPVANADDECYISDHTDIGMGLNAKAANSEDAKKLLMWMTTEEFASLLTNALPGFFSLSNHFIDVEDPTASAMMSWRDECDSTIRNSYQILSRGEPNLERQLWQVSVDVIEGKLAPADGAAQLQQGLDSWYKP